MKLYIDDLEAKIEENEKFYKEMKSEINNLNKILEETQKKLSKAQQELQKKDNISQELIGKIKKLEQNKIEIVPPMQNKQFLGLVKLQRKLHSVKYSPKNAEFPIKMTSRNLSSIRTRKSSKDGNMYKNSFHQRHFSSINARPVQMALLYFFLL